jgi:hypothetical protein
LLQALATSVIGSWKAARRSASTQMLIGALEAADDLHFADARALERLP